jgi:hypothetical protein
LVRVNLYEHIYNLITDDDQQKQDDEAGNIVESKEKLLNYVICENDDLEREILRLNDSLIQELNKVECNHRDAIEDLVAKYEKSLNNMKTEITSTVKKLKESSGYYETVLSGIEEGYEVEIESNEQTKTKQNAQNKALNMEDEVKRAKYKHYDETNKHDELDKSTKENLDALIKEKDFLNDISNRVHQTLAKTEDCQQMIGLK